MRTFWYVYKRGGGPPSYQHISYELALAEAQRLIDRVGGEYEILKAEAVVRPAPKYTVEELCPENGQRPIDHSRNCTCTECIPF